jgi:hypothetical protein
MEAAFFVIAVIGLLALTASRAEASTTTGRGAAYYQPPPSTWTATAAQSAPPAQFSGGQFSGGPGADVAIVGTAGTAAGGAVSKISSLGSAAPIIGAAVGAIAAIGAMLLAAHEQRKKAATDENSAMNLGVRGWDNDIRVINTAFRSKQLDPQSAIKFLRQITDHYWQLVTPHIQSGRNGCGSGTSCSNPPYTTKCSGNNGAACCVGCVDLVWSRDMAINAIQAGGGDALVTKVFGSKYGGVQRDEYTLTWRQ